VFTPAERSEIAARVVAALETDPRIGHVEGFGSIQGGTADRHSDVDLAVVLREDADPPVVADDWFERVRDLLPVVHGFRDLVGPVEGCGFLLETHLEVDLAFGHAAAVAAALERDPPDRARLARAYLDFAWHDVVHAAVAIDRGRPLRAIFYIDRVRDRAVELACLRLALDERHHKDADELPGEVRVQLEAAVPTSLDDDGLFGALQAATRVFYAETRDLDANATDRLESSLLAYIDEIEHPRSE
jgi:hypothetical protein